jgi:hypothetical protein
MGSGAEDRHFHRAIWRTRAPKGGVRCPNALAIADAYNIEPLNLLADRGNGGVGHRCDDQHSRCVDELFRAVEPIN